MANLHVAYCMQDVHNILLYYNTDVVTIKPVTGRASVCSTSVETARRLIAWGFHTEKEVCQHSHSSDPVPVHTIHANTLQYIALRNRLISVSVLNCIALCRIAILLHIDILWQLCRGQLLKRVKKAKLLIYIYTGFAYFLVQIKWLHIPQHTRIYRGYLGPGGLSEWSQYYDCTGGAAGMIDRWLFTNAHILQSPTAKVNG